MFNKENMSKVILLDSILILNLMALDICTLLVFLAVLSASLQLLYSLFLPSPQNLIPMETVYFYTTRNQAEGSNLGHKPQFASQWIQNALLPETEDDYKS